LLVFLSLQLIADQGDRAKAKGTTDGGANARRPHGGANNTAHRCAPDGPDARAFFAGSQGPARTANHAGQNDQRTNTDQRSFYAASKVVSVHGFLSNGVASGKTISDSLRASSLTRNGCRARPSG
jgi:hypothetical protein